MDMRELDAMRSVLETLKPLDEHERARVLAWVSDKLGLAPVTPKKPVKPGSLQATDNNGGSEHSTFADLYNAAQPSTNAERALVGGYWLQVCQTQDQFTGQVINKQLQDLGHVIGNITNAFTQLKSKKPALAIQVKKSGKSQQARKQYKLTQAGIEAVKVMLERGDF